MQQVPGLQSAWLLHPKHEQSLKAGEGTRGKENNMNNAIGEAEGKGPAIDVWKGSVRIARRNDRQALFIYVYIVSRWKKPTPLLRLHFPQINSAYPTIYVSIEEK